MGFFPPRYMASTPLVVRYIHLKFYMELKTCTLTGQKGRAQKRNFGTKISMIYPSIGNFIWSRRKYTLGVKKVKTSHQSPTEFKLEAARIVKFNKKNLRVNK
jgi:hypothetical protein